VFIFFDVIYAPLKLGLYRGGLEYILYAPKAAMALLPILSLIYIRKTGSMMITFILLLAMGVSAIIGYHFFGSIPQIAFEFYIFFPLLFGCYYGAQLWSPSVVKALTILWFVASLGIIGNFFGDYPWSGLDLEIDGRAVHVARAWATDLGGVSRLAGFSSASYSVACQLMVIGTILLFLEKRLALKLVYSIVGFALIIATTTKGAIAAYFVILLIFWSRKLGNRIYMPTLIIASLANVLLPLYAYHQYLFSKSISESGVSGFQYWFIGLNSFVARIAWFWPNVMKFILDHGSAYWGAGLGGMGTSVVLFYDEGVQIASADNMFLYLFGNFGLLAVIFYIFLVIRPMMVPWTSYYRFAKLLILLTVLYGVIGVPIERPTFCLVMGSALGMLFRRRQKEGARRLRPYVRNRYVLSAAAWREEGAMP